MEKRDEIDCYEVESLASRPLVDGLNVTKVPSVQIYDPDGVTRLADGPCMPDDFPRLERKVDVVISPCRSGARRTRSSRGATRRSCATCGRRTARRLRPVSRMSEEEFEAFEAAVCAICPPQGRLRGALRTTEPSGRRRPLCRSELRGDGAVERKSTSSYRSMQKRRSVIFAATEGGVGPPGPQLTMGECAGDVGAVPRRGG